jgi:hypothetical protein
MKWQHYISIVFDTGCFPLPASITLYGKPATIVTRVLQRGESKRELVHAISGPYSVSSTCLPPNRLVAGMSISHCQQWEPTTENMGCWDCT